MIEIPVMPERIARLDRDQRGYPIPWNVLRGDDGTPHFTVNDDRKHYRALREELCPLCGERLGRWKHFIGGPQSAFHAHGAYMDLPTHHDCGRFALATCPYLAAPNFFRELGVTKPDKLPPEARILVDHTIDNNRPGVFVMVAATKVAIIRNEPPALPYVKPMAVAGYEFWRHGKEITQAEALPFLRAIFGEEWKVPAAPCE